jgi:prophage tail gpP-like protein
MSTLPDVVEVKIGDVAHKGWTQYEIDSDLLTPADAWRVRLAQPVIALPPQVVVGATVEVRLNGDLVLKGILDERTLTVSAGQHELNLSGRDGAGVLLDCSVPLLAMRDVTLEQVLANVLGPLKIPASRIRTSAVSKLLREKINTEPGDTAWDTLRRVAEANGLWPWFEPDGTLVVGGPNYDLPAVATLLLRADGKGNNVLSLAEHRSIVDRYSEVTVYGQAHASGSGAGERDGRNNIKITVPDKGVLGYRPKVVVDHEAVNTDIARARARKVISDSKLKAYTLTAVVQGHRTDKGVLWTPGQRVVVQSEPHGLDGIYFLMARRFTGDKSIGQRTQLTLKEDGVWLLDAHPSKRKHRRGKNSLPLQVLDFRPRGGQ